MTTRNEVKRRDDYTCQKCGYRSTNGDRLQAHHIHPSWAEGSDDVQNLITLCNQCHRFAPEHKSKEKCYRKMSAFLDTGVRPEYDLVLFGLQAAAAQEDEADIEQVDTVRGAIQESVQATREKEGLHESRRPHSYWSEMYSFARGQLLKAELVDSLFPEVSDRFEHVEQTDRVEMP